MAEPFFLTSEVTALLDRWLATRLSPEAAAWLEKQDIAVAEGDKRGRDLGFPTANVAVPGDILLPADGIYAGWYVRPDGVPLGASPLEPGPLGTTINVTAGGEYVPNALVNTGATAPDLPGTMGTTCGDWKTSAGKEYAGAVTNINVWFQNGDPTDCNPGFFIYCLQE